MIVQKEQESIHRSSHTDTQPCHYPHFMPLFWSKGGPSPDLDLLEDKQQNQWHANASGGGEPRDVCTHNCRRHAWVTGRVFKSISGCWCAYSRTQSPGSGPTSHHQCFPTQDQPNLIQSMRIFGGLEGKKSNRNLFAGSISICLGMK